jgi:hypothetical protein
MPACAAGEAPTPPKEEKTRSRLQDHREKVKTMLAKNNGHQGDVDGWSTIITPPP